MMRKTMSIPEPLADHTRAEAAELRRVGEIGIARAREMRLLQLRRENLSASAAVSFAVSRGASGQIGCSVPCKRQIGGAFTPR